MTESSTGTGGALYIVATPIGNREDITQRAINILQQVDIILAEDTRHSGPFLASLGIKKRLICLHTHNEAQKTNEMIQLLLAGQACALISDAGTPLISDPGFPLVKLAREHGISVIPIPGPCALITALCASGVPTDIFTFCGFLPAKSVARQRKLEALKGVDHTLIFYESTHRLDDSINDIAHVFGESTEIVLAKELTKSFEQFIVGTHEKIKNWLNEDLRRGKGEFVLIIPPRQKSEEDLTHDHILSILLKELSLKQAVNIATQLTHVSKKLLYNRALVLQKQNQLNEN